MLQVKTYIDKSQIHGIGLFANQFIPAGTIIWAYEVNIDKVIQEHEFLSIKANHNEDIIKEFRKNISKMPNLGYMLYGDNARFINHSTNPNMSIESRAIRDIDVGEELTENYLEIYEDDEDISFLKSN